MEWRRYVCLLLGCSSFPLPRFCEEAQWSVKAEVLQWNVEKLKGVPHNLQPYSFRDMVTSLTRHRVVGTRRLLCVTGLLLWRCHLTLQAHQTVFKEGQACARSRHSLRPLGKAEDVASVCGLSQTSLHPAFAPRAFWRLRKSQKALW